MPLDILMVVNFNAHIEVHQDVVIALAEAYSPHFRGLVFTGQDRPQLLPANIKWVDCEFEWTAFYLCLSNVMLEELSSATMRPGGYLMIGDDVIMDLCQLADLPLDMFWIRRFERKMRHSPGPRQGWHWQTKHARHVPYTLSEGIDRALTTLPTKFNQSLWQHGGPHVDQNGTLHKTFDSTLVDFLYVPSQFVAPWVQLGHHFWRYAVMTELAVPHMIIIIGGQSSVIFPTEFNYVATGLVANVLDRSDAVLQPGQGFNLCALQLNPEVLNTCTTFPIFYHAFKLSNATLLSMWQQWWHSQACV